MTQNPEPPLPPEGHNMSTEKPDNFLTAGQLRAALGNHASPEASGREPDAFYEWLLSDNADAQAERRRRREAAYQTETGRAQKVLAWAVRVSSAKDASPAARDLAETMGPIAARSAHRAVDSFAVPDADFVAKARTDWENFRRADDPDYRYPARYTGEAAATQPRPEPEPEPEAEP